MDAVEKCILFVEPQSEYHFEKCKIAGGNISRDNGVDVLSAFVEFKTYSVKYKGGP